MDHQDWLQRYKPVQNHFDPNGADKLYETYGKQYEYVIKQDCYKIWTLLDTEGDIYIANGLYIVNRLGYYLTEKPFDSKALIQVTLN